ncbi:MAG: hypothetical protein WEA56_12610 [Balneolaceae bacterium]
MPVQSIWMIRLSLQYFLTAVLIGGLLLAHKAVGIHPALWSLLPVHFEMAIWGWLIQFVMGTAYWIFPRFLDIPPRGSEKAAWLVVLFLNTGILLVVASYLMPSEEWARVTGRLLALAGIGTFISLMWNRITTYRNR